MEAIKLINLEVIRAAKSDSLYFAPNTFWWTHDPAHLSAAHLRGQHIIRDGETFLKAAEYNPSQFGRHGLRAFLAAHHQNCYVSFDDLTHTSAQTWGEYNDALDRLDELKNILRPDSPDLIDKLKLWLGKERANFFNEVYERYGRLNVSWMDGSVPHPVHFREGLEVRNKLRSITAFLWSDHDYDGHWEECVLRAIGKFNSGGQVEHHSKQSELTSRDLPAWPGAAFTKR